MEIPFQLTYIIIAFVTPGSLIHANTPSILFLLQVVLRFDMSTAVAAKRNVNLIRQTGVSVERYCHFSVLISLKTLGFTFTMKINEKRDHSKTVIDHFTGLNVSAPWRETRRSPHPSIFHR